MVGPFSLSLSREDEHMSTGEGVELSEGAELGDGNLTGSREGQENTEEEVPRINVEIPRCVANLGSDIHFVKLPNFLSVETRYCLEISQVLSTRLHAPLSMSVCV